MRRCVQANSPVLAPGRDPTEADPAVSSPCKESVLHPVLDGTVSFLAALISKLQWDRKQMPFARHPVQPN